MKAEDVAALLDGDHVAGGEGLAVPNMVYSVDDGDCEKSVRKASQTRQTPRLIPPLEKSQKNFILPRVPRTG